MRIENHACQDNEDMERFELKNQKCKEGDIDVNIDTDNEDRYNYRLLPVENKEDTYKIFS